MLTIIQEEKIKRIEVAHGYGGVGGRLIGGATGATLGFMAGGGPIGFFGGALTGSLVGNYLGKKIGEKIIEDPEKPADFEKASHRVGILGNRQFMPLSTTFGNYYYPYLLSTGTIPHPISIGLGLTSRVANSVPGGIADQIGYKTPGRIWTALVGPVGGIVPPDKIKKNK